MPSFGSGRIDNSPKKIGRRDIVPEKIEKGRAKMQIKIENDGFVMKTLVRVILKIRKRYLHATNSNQYL